MILDASVALAWYLNEGSSLANSVMRKLGSGDISATVPHIWPLEVANGIVMSERRGRITRADADEGLRSLAEMPVDIHITQELGAVIDAARIHRLTVYDATYLALAQHLKLPIATLDDRLRAAAVVANVELFAS